MGTANKSLKVNQEELMPTESQLKALSEQEVRELKLAPHELWFLALDDQTQGPFTLENLKNYLLHNPQLELKAMACNGSEQIWRPWYQFLELQRRNPQIISNIESSPSDKFYLLVNGQKNGPLSEKDIEEKISKQELLYTDMISVDNGGVWFKIYEHPHFNRRSFYKREDLPFGPDKSTLSASNREALLHLQKTQAHTEQDELALMALANLQKNIVKDKSAATFTETAAQSIKNGLSQRRIRIPIIALLILLIGPIFVQQSKKPQVQQTQSDAQQSIVANTKITTRTTSKPSIKHTANAKDANTKLAHPQGVSLTKSSGQQDLSANIGETDQRDSYNTDQREQDTQAQMPQVPVELDPIHKTLSRDTINPDNTDENNGDEVTDETKPVSSKVNKKNKVAETPKLPKSVIQDGEYQAQTEEAPVQ